MGFFDSKKTSVDYLKEISKENKRQTQAMNKAAEAEYAKAQAIVDAERERTRAAILMKDRAERKELSKQIGELVFDPNQPNDIVANLSFLCSLIDGWLSSSKSERCYRSLCKAAESKFKMGLTQLSVVDSSHAMLPYFKDKIDEFKVKREKLRKHEILKISIPGGIFILDVLIFCIYGTVIDWDYDTHPTLAVFMVLAFLLFFTFLVILITRSPVDRDPASEEN